MNIELRKDNVVKIVDSEDKAKALENKGFVRTDGKTVPAVLPDAEVKELKEQLVRAAGYIKTADEIRGKLEEELAVTRAKLEEASKYAEKADKKIESLSQELSGTREQLEAAIKKNKDADKK